MLNLDLLDGISFSKGCYTGQEIIARTSISPHQAPPVSLQLPPGDWRIGQPLRLSDCRSGRLIEGFGAAAASKRWPFSMCTPRRSRSRISRRDQRSA